MNDLRDILARTAEQLSPDAGLDELGTARLTRKVRHRRAVRQVERGTVATAAAAAVGFGGYLAVRHGTRPVAPAATTSSPAPSTGTPSAPASAGPSASASASPTASATSVDLPGLGTLPQATSATLSSVTAGWAVIWWAPVRLSAWSDAPARADLLLASPDGTLYHLSQVDTSLLPSAMTAGAGWWRAGASTMVVATEPSTHGGGSQVLSEVDLLSGAVSTVRQLPSGALVDGWTSDGRAVVRSGSTVEVLDSGAGAVHLGTSDGTASTVSADGLSVAFVAGTTLTVSTVDATSTTTLTLPAQGCLAVGWQDATHVVVECTTDDAQPVTTDYLATVSGSTSLSAVPWDASLPDVSAPGSPVWGAGILDGCSLHTVVDGAVRRLATGTDSSALAFGTAGGITWFGTGDSCSEASPFGVSARKADGSTSRLVPLLPGSDWYANVWGVVPAG